jgi:hypothetical protein
MLALVLMKNKMCSVNWKVCLLWPCMYVCVFAAHICERGHFWCAIPRYNNKFCFLWGGGWWVHSMDELRSTQIHPIFLSRATRFVHYARRQTVFCLLLMTSFIIETHNFYFLPFLLSLMPWHTCFHVCMFSKTWFFVVKIVASTPLTVIWDSPKL